MNKTFSQLKSKVLKNAEVKVEYKAMAPEYEVIKSIIRERQKKGLTQLQLAERVGTRQPVISRLESGEGNPTINQLQKIAKALDLKVVVTLQ